MTIAAAIADRLLDFAVARGASRSELLGAAGLASLSSFEAEGRLPVAAYLGLLRAGATQLDDPLFALRFGAEVDMSDMSIVGMLSMASATVGDAFDQVNRFGSLAIDIGAEERFAFDSTARGVWLIDQRGPPFQDRELTEAAFARMVAGMRAFDPPLLPLGFEVTYPRPAHHRAYAQYLAAPVTFAARRNAILLDRDFFKQRLNRLPDYAGRALTERAELLLTDYRRGQTLRGRVEQVLEATLAKAPVGMARIAAQLGCSRWTLARRLAQEGTSFEAVLDGVRLRLADRYLADPALSVSQISYLLGFSEPSAFTRALRRLVGTGPRRYRASILARAETER